MNERRAQRIRLRPVATLAQRRLEHLRTRPHIITVSVRSTLREAISWRVGGGNAPTGSAFVTAACSAARLMVDTPRTDLDERARTLIAVREAAQRFAQSALYGRLMSIPVLQIEHVRLTSDGPDVIVHDRCHRTHAIILSMHIDGLQAARIATRAAQAFPPRSGPTLLPVTVHVYALGGGVRRTFERDLGKPSNDPEVRVA